MSPTDTQNGLADRSMGFGLRALNKLAGSDLLDRIGLRKQAERALFQGTKSGFRSVTAASRTFAAAQKLGKPARQSTAKKRVLFDLTPDDEQQMLKEAVGSSSADGRWVYVSDGGHLDNTGLVEAVRHTLTQGAGGRVLCLDASNDAPRSWQAVGDAVSVVRADLDVSLVRVHDKALPPWARLYRAEPDDAAHQRLEVLVVKAVRVDEPPADKVPDPDWWSALPSDVQAFQTVHSDFPRASTVRQEFGDLEFEAYRQLGYVSTAIALERAGWLPPPPKPPPAHDPAH